MSTTDPHGGSEAVQHSYQYSGGGAWHYDEDPMTPAKERTWSIWRGYQQVTHLTGLSGRTQSKETSIYLRGMNGDRVLGSDGKTPDPDKRKTITVTGIKASQITDAEQYAGFTRESVTYNGSDEVGGTVNDPGPSGRRPSTSPTPTPRRTTYAPPPPTPAPASPASSPPTTASPPSKPPTTTTAWPPPSRTRATTRSPATRSAPAPGTPATTTRASTPSSPAAAPSPPPAPPPTRPSTCPPTPPGPAMSSPTPPRSTTTSRQPPGQRPRSRARARSPGPDAPRATAPMTSPSGRNSPGRRTTISGVSRPSPTPTTCRSPRPPTTRPTPAR
ncbi:hypothetical protein ACFQ3Z_45005 [Streptomyces nogalater]